MAQVKNCASPQQAAEFDGYVAKWQTLLHLGDWRIERVGKAAKDAMASVEFNDPARLATYRLGDFGAETINASSLEKAAIHELLHVLLRDLLEAAQDRSTTPEALEAQEHRVINVLERLLAGMQ